MTQQILPSCGCRLSPNNVKHQKMSGWPVQCMCTVPRSVMLHTSFILLSSSTRGFSKSRTCVFPDFSVIGPNLDRRFCSHSLPPCLDSSLGVSGGSGFVFLFLACALMLQLPLRYLYTPQICRGCTGRAFTWPSCLTDPF